MNTYEVLLLDDGSLDTVISYKGQEFRFSDTANYRDRTGTLDMAAFLADYGTDIEDAWHETREQFTHSGPE